MSIYEAVKFMTKEEFISFVEMIYNKGRIDGEMLVDDGPWIRQCMADFPADDMDEIK